MIISIITVCYNAEKTIEKTITSVLNQDYNNIEYIIVDGNSTDKTMNIISNYRNKVDIIISENDNGIYDAINKGIKAASGEIIGILNADDILYNNHIITKIAEVFIESPELESVIGDIIFQDSFNKKRRHYSSNQWSIHKFSSGYMPPHPSFYCKKNNFNKFGFYNTSFKIAADYELLIRFLKVHNLSYKYVPLIFVKMSFGGVSTRGISSFITINSEIFKACKLNGIKTNYFKLLFKYFYKVFEFTRL